jgi:hypothetical protein
MYIRVTRGQMDPARFDEVTQVNMGAAVKQLPGCLSYMRGRDRASGRVVVISTWDTEEHAGWSAPDVLGDRVSRLQALGVQMDTPEIFEATDT